MICPPEAYRNRRVFKHFLGSGWHWGNVDGHEVLATGDGDVTYFHVTYEDGDQEAGPRLLVLHSGPQELYSSGPYLRSIFSIRWMLAVKEPHPTPPRHRCKLLVSETLLTPLECFLLSHLISQPMCG